MHRAISALLNTNSPHLSKGEPKGVRVVPQASKGFDEFYISQVNEQGQTVFQLSGMPNHKTEDKSADTTSLQEGFATITVLAPDMTNYEKTHELRQIKW